MIWQAVGKYFRYPVLPDVRAWMNSGRPLQVDRLQDPTPGPPFMTMSSRTVEKNALNTILTKTQRLLRIEADKQNSAFHKAQLLLSEYIVMLTDTQAENCRMRVLLGRYDKSKPAARNIPASTVIAQLQGRIRTLQAVVATLRNALENIQACESEAAERNAGEIAAHALRDTEDLRNGSRCGH